MVRLAGFEPAKGLPYQFQRWRACHSTTAARSESGDLSERRLFVFPFRQTVCARAKFGD